MECFDPTGIILSVMWAFVAIYCISFFEKKAGVSTGFINDVSPPLLISLILAVIYSIVLYKFQDHSDKTGIESIPLLHYLKNTVCALDDIFSGLSYALTGFVLRKYYKYWRRYR